MCTVPLTLTRVLGKQPNPDQVSSRPKRNKETSKCPLSRRRNGGRTQGGKAAQRCFAAGMHSEPAATSIFHHTASQRPDMLRRQGIFEALSALRPSPQVRSAHPRLSMVLPLRGRGCGGLSPQACLLRGRRQMWQKPVLLLGKSANRVRRIFPSPVPTRFLTRITRWLIAA